MEDFFQILWPSQNIRILLKCPKIAGAKAPIAPMLNTPLPIDTWICKPNKIHCHISFTRNFFQVNEITSWDFILVQLLIVKYESKFEIFEIE